MCCRVAIVKLFLVMAWMAAAPGLAAQNAEQKWVDSVMTTLSTADKIAQLMVLPVSAYDGEAVARTLSRVKSFGIGSVVLTAGGPHSARQFVQIIQQQEGVPLLIGCHHGSIDSLDTLPAPLVLAAAGDSAVFKAGREFARQLKRLGFHFSFLPSPEPIPAAVTYPAAINYFSDEGERALHHAQNYIAGMRSHNLQPFGNYLSQPSALLFDSARLQVYQQLGEQGMVALLVDHYPPQANWRTERIPLAAQIMVSEALKKRLGFAGITLAHVPALQTVTQKVREGETEALALAVGYDALYDPQSINGTIKKIQRTLRKNMALRAHLDNAVRKILYAKYRATSGKKTSPPEDNLLTELNPLEHQILNTQLARAAITVLKAQPGEFPIQALENKTFLSVSVGSETPNDFSKYLGKYVSFRHVALRTATDTALLQQNIKPTDVVVVGCFPLSASFLSQIMPMLQRMAAANTVIWAHFADVQVLPPSFANIMLAYAGEKELQRAAAQVIFGGRAANGKLPLNIKNLGAIGNGITTAALNRLAFSWPEEVGMSSERLAGIEAIAREAIDSGAAPGGITVVIKDGHVVYEKPVGWQTYENKIAVTAETIYDLASVTKITATLQAVMFLYDRGMIDLNKKASFYLPELKNTNKEGCTLIDILTHQAGLWPFLPFWADTMKDSLHLPQYYASAKSDDFPLAVAPNLYGHRSMKDSLWQWTVRSRMRDKPARTPYDYRYSDMGFYILQRLAEKLLNQPIENFVAHQFYEPIGAHSLGYLPLERFPPSQIAPTENDRLFRKSLLTGYVHDQGAAMHGGVAGHAGLFGNALDLAKMGQMWLQRGTFGGVKFFKPETIDLFTRKQFETSRRGLGWDKPAVGDWAGPTSLYASARTFGHTGFTGTCIWVDPQFNLVFVFLSNRVYPRMTNNKLLDLNIRPRIQSVVYQAIFDYEATRSN
jgi:CubicO group peptidase (beta-lactamase class C family)/beta-glucosidase-like glycosyl hydrolase